MSRSLAVIAVFCFALCAAFLALAFLIAGGQLFHNEKPFAKIKPLIDLATHKEWRWNGGDTLAVNAPVNLRYRVAGPAQVAVSGPTDMMRGVQFGGGQISSNPGHAEDADRKRLDVVVSGVPIRKFIVKDRQQVDLGHIHQKSLDIRINGRSALKAEGHVDELTLVVSGKGSANLGALVVETAKVAILGNGGATLAPHNSLYLTIAGNGVAQLMSRPQHLQKTIFGGGQVIEMPSSIRPVIALGNYSADWTKPYDLSYGGREDFKIGHIERDAMTMEITGPGSVSADGNANQLTVTVSGKGNADLGQLAAHHINVSIIGSGNAIIAPRDAARISIIGTGNVYLLTKPAKIDRTILGTGHIFEAH